jgi:hypothetical protein
MNLLLLFNRDQILKLIKALLIILLIEQKPVLLIVRRVSYVCFHQPKSTILKGIEILSQDFFSSKRVFSKYRLGMIWVIIRQIS